MVKGGFTSRLLGSDALQLFAPELLFYELLGHSITIKKKSNKTITEVHEAIDALRTLIRVVPSYELVGRMSRAQRVSPGPDDAVYFAAALCLGCPLWSQDKALKKHDVVKVYTTAELAAELEMT